MRRIGILTAGGDTPALNATIFGAVERANALRIEVVGIIRGFAGIVDPRVPHVRLNPLFTTIPELDPTKGGTLLGASRTYIDPDQVDLIGEMTPRIQALELEGLICIGGDGTINGMQPLSELFPCVLAPKTIDNDLGLNYIDEPNEWAREEHHAGGKATYFKTPQRESIELEDIINFATPGYATAVFVVTQGIERIRTTAESHRRIAIIEVMGRDSGYIPLGSAYGQPDIVLLPEFPLDMDHLEERVATLYDLQKHVVIVVGEGVRDSEGRQLGAATKSYDPAGNVIYSGAAEELKRLLAARFGDDYFGSRRQHESADSAIFTRKVGHTQRGGRPILFDRFYATQLGGKAVDLLQQGQNNSVATLQWSKTNGFYLDSIPANKLRDRWKRIHPRHVHPSLYDAKRFQPSRLGKEYLMTMLTNAIGADDIEVIRSDLFSPGKLSTRYQSINIDIQRRIETIKTK
ncbi:6-phosphofructokinase [Planctellipticum variicoloris]|uniref:6-phosphofructokinase n=1 Tax=Planctellipticum variicoloris TaxID=3064265 RepID=UPI0030136E67|nr:6-phosphofructokinase [Planctomycetaceae bacterium SH412]